MKPDKDRKFAMRALVASIVFGILWIAFLYASIAWSPGALSDLFGTLPP